MRKIVGLVLGMMILGVGVLAPERVMAWNDPACADMTAEERELAGCNTTATGEETFIKKVTGVLNVVLPMVALLAVVMVVISGVMMSVSMGDPGKIKRAKSMLTYSLIGMVIALMAYAIVNFVLQYFD